MSQPQRPQVEPADLSERGAGATSDRRLFMQFHAYGECDDTPAVIDTLRLAGSRAVLYEDANDPFGIGVVTWSEAPDDFIGEHRRLLRSDPFRTLLARPELTMFGRTYAIGYERDLNQTLIDRPLGHLLADDWPWAVWYPLRRKGGFTQLPRDQQMTILKEHGTIGMRFGATGKVGDIRLACHGLDAADNDFVIGLLGEDLTPLSKLVEAMRGTVQTSTWLQKLGPFFVGKKVWQGGG